MLPEVIALDLTKTNKLSVPLMLFEGRHDRNVNAEVAATWFDMVKAADKHLVWFEHSGHIPMTEEPGKFLLSLVRYARPIAEKWATLLREPRIRVHPTVNEERSVRGGVRGQRLDCLDLSPHCPTVQRKCGKRRQNA
jgi:hypothetical protein